MVYQPCAILVTLPDSVQHLHIENSCF
uniref:Uncharacterized protein n=1 Tax=Arundo donax TaxID=35708 RepID=A0A0A9ATN9_ARUDO